MSASKIPPAYQGIDFSQWKTWPTVVIYGQTYYQVPGMPDKVFDPTAGPAGTVSTRPDVQVNTQKEIQGAVNPQPTIADQLVPIGGSLAGTLGGAYIIKNALAPTATTTAPAGILGGNVASAGTTAGTTANTVASIAPTNTTGIIGSTAADQSISLAPGASESGYTLGATGTEGAAEVVPAGTPAAAGDWMTASPGTVGQAVGIVTAAKGGFDTIKDWQHGGSGRTGLTELGAGIGSFGGPAGAVIGAGMGNLAGYGMQGNGPLNHAALLVNPLTWPLEAAKLAGINLIHKTTRQVAQEHTDDLLKQNKEDKQYQDYVSSMRQQYNAAPADKEHPFAGKYASWDEYKKGGLEAGDLTGVYGNLKTFGADWSKLTQEQRVKVTQGLINAGLYDSKKGEVIITDPEAAKKIKDSIIGPQAAPKAEEKPGVAATASKVQAITRPGATPNSKKTTTVSNPKYSQKNNQRR